VLKNNGFHNRHSPFSRPFSPASLFANGEQGWWFDPSNFETLFQDSAGTTPVTAMEQPVGLQLDLSKGLVLGSELVTNGDFSNGTTGWTANGTGASISASGGVLTLTQTGGDYGRAYQTLTGLTVGQFYQYTASVVSNPSARAAQIWAHSSFTGTPAAGQYSATITGTGNLVVRFQATATTMYVVMWFNTVSAGSLGFSTASTKNIPGNHRFQSTSANRPVVSARVNLLTKTEQFDDGAWVKSSGSITATNVAAPDGTLTAEVFTPTAQFAYVLQNLPTSITTGSVTVSVWLRTQSGTRELALRGTASSTLYLTFITVTTTWTQFSATYAYNGTNPIDQFLVQDRNTSGFVPIEIWASDLRPTNQGVGLPAYQRVNTSTDYDSTGFPIYIKPNGSNQFMVTSSINFSATDKMTVWQGVRKLSDAAFGVFAETGTNSFVNAGSFALSSAAISPGPFYALLGSGSSGYAADFQTYTAPITNVLTAQFDIAQSTGSTEVTLRVNSATATRGPTVGTSMGTGNFGTYPTYFYARAGTSLFFGGNDYGSIARGAASTAAQITNGETYINSLTKAF
jgi:hypothetical protein